MDPANAGATSPGDATRRIKEAASTAAERGKTVASEQISAGAQGVQNAASTTASALRRAADDVGQEHRWIGQGLRKSADTIEQATQSIAGGDLDQTVNQIGAFARRQPALFIGAGLALGFVLARVGKTAIERSQDEPLDRSMGY